MAELVEVRTLPDRLAYTDASMKTRIPNDRFITLPRTKYIDDLINVHGDIEVKSAEPSAAPTPSKPPAK
jgi:hypothetical protein